VLLHRRKSDETLRVFCRFACISGVPEMSSYQVLPGTNSGFKIEVTSNGIRQTMLGFDTEADALAWIETDRARERIYLGRNPVGDD